MEPVIIENNIEQNEQPVKKLNPLFKFMGIGSLIYAVCYTFFLYKNNSGITYPFFVGGTCLFFFLYLKKSGITAKKFSIFLTVSLILLGISTCSTDSWVLIFLNKLGIFCLFFYLMLHNLYEDKNWGLLKYTGSVMNIVCTSLAFIFRPFSDFSGYWKNRKEQENKTDGKGKYVLIGVIIALPLLLVILLLLGSADAVFGNILNHIIFFDIDPGDHFFGISFLFLFAFFASYSIMSRLSVHDLKEEVSDKRTAEPVIGITFTAIISVVYLIFCFIQIVYLFGGWGTLPENYTYASYAREGFFQLVFVCLINLALVLTCMKRFQENNMLKGILTFISICTYIMIASSTYRMLLYIQVYYLTFLRVFVLWALFVIFLLISGALIMIYKKEFPLTRYYVIVITVCYLMFSFAHPDYWITCYNLDHSMSQTNEVYDDYYYLRNLSSDAAPAIFAKAEKYDYEENKWFLSYSVKIADRLPQTLTVRKWNLSRWKAYNLFVDFKQTHDDFSAAYNEYYDEYRY